MNVWIYAWFMVDSMVEKSDRYSSNSSKLTCPSLFLSITSTQMSNSSSLLGHSQKFFYSHAKRRLHKYIVHKCARKKPTYTGAWLPWKAAAYCSKFNWVKSHLTDSCVRIDARAGLLVEHAVPPCPGSHCHLGHSAATCLWSPVCACADVSRCAAKPTVCCLVCKTAYSQNSGSSWSDKLFNLYCERNWSAFIDRTDVVKYAADCISLLSSGKTVRWDSVKRFLRLFLSLYSFLVGSTWAQE